ncbi:MAG: cysteine synthase A [Candidatus Omnitrophota bacterium]|jgi:cysteine synthase A
MNILFKDITGFIGNTPMVPLNRIVEPGMAKILVKLEYFNPGGSIKDRICLAMIEDAEKKGLIKKGSTIVEPTSGNTGIGLAMIAAARGYKCVLTMPDTMSVERREILKAYGAEIVLTPGAQGMAGACQKAAELSKKTKDSFVPQQFTNPANPEAHRRTTAKEILNDTAGVLDAFVAGVGTGGTITGVGETLKAHDPKIKIIAVEPKKSPVLSGGKPGPHKIQGIGAGFIPDVLNRKIIDSVIQVADEDAIETARALSKHEGLFAGISSGAAVWAAMETAKKLGQGKTVVTILPDTGERYISMMK